MRSSRTFAWRAVVGSIVLAIPAALLVPTVANAAGHPSFGAGSVFVADDFEGRLMEVPADGTAPFALVPGNTLGGIPDGVVLDGRGNVYVASYLPKGGGNARVAEVPADGSPYTVLDSDLTWPQGVAADAAGDVFVADPGRDSVIEIPAGGGSPTTIASGLNLPTDVASDAAGDLYISEQNSGDVVEIAAGTSKVVTIASGLSSPQGLAVDTDGNVYVADTGHDKVVEFAAGTGAVTTIASGLASAYDVALDAAGDVYIADPAGGQVIEIPADGSGRTDIDGVGAPVAVAVYAPAPTFAADSPPASATVGTSYAYRYTADVVAGEPAARFRVASGTLPPGLGLDSETGALSGTPTTAGTYTFTVQAENAVTASVAPSTTISVVAADTTAPESTVTVQHGPVDRYQSLLTLRGTAVVKDRTGTTLGTVGPVTCWNSRGVIATLDATDTGSGVASLTYRATGAGRLPSTTATDLPATVAITRAGRTTLEYHAVDNAGNSEPVNSEDVVDGDVWGLFFACALPAPARFALPAHGTIALTGTVTISGRTYPFHATIRF